MNGNGVLAPFFLWGIYLIVSCRKCSCSPVFFFYYYKFICVVD